MSKELIEQLRDLANCRHDDLSIGYKAADRIEQLETERDQLREQVKMLQSAIKNLRDVKGRHHSEIAYKRLIEALDATEPKE